MSFTFRCVDAVADAPLLHSWVTQPYASFWGMLSSTVEGVVEEYSKIQATGHHHAVLGINDDGLPAFLMEEYLPAASPLAAVYAVQEGDIGMHLLVAPPSGDPQPGYTAAVMDAVLERLFENARVERVVVEPDARNSKIQVLNERLGFHPSGVVNLPDKEALLSFCTRQDYLAAHAALRHPQDPSHDLSAPIHQGASL
ncbi:MULTISPECIES: GNAT family N-acetyltransferase [unclassified Arthrobacter]|uniref:GNAT family N-acetyltransferase n=1 Tax=Pseudarthrobacter sp. S6 TaxID=3418420 RepID=UPI0033926DC1